MPSGKSSARTSDPYNLHWLTYLKGRLLAENEWYYNDLNLFVQTRIKVAGAAPLYLEIPVCDATNPTHGSYAIKHRGSGLWYLSPTVYLKGRDEKTWLTKSSSFHPLLDSMFLVLTNAPESVDEALMQLQK